IQILNWNRAQDTQRAIKSALNQTYSNIEIVMVDNGSTDNSIALTKANYPNIKIVALDKNYGCPGGRNLGISHCCGEFIFYLDNDGVLHKEAVQNAYNTVMSEENVGVVTGVIYDFYDESEIDANCNFKSLERYESHVFNGGISMHKKSIYDDVGFYPKHFMYGYEETYLSLKLSDTSHKIIEDCSVVLWHIGSNTARDRSKEILSGYFNKLYTAFSLYPFSKLAPFFFYFLLKYPGYAKKEGIAKQFWLKFRNDFFSTIRMGIEDRNPISSEAILRFNKLSNHVLG
ncbi:MAG: glycosyltransferase, partial [Eudoraea sp.]|nr:glycosyltransferase [Eudoraea sp.]